MITIITELTEEFEGQFKSLGENAEKYLPFLVPIKKENENGKTVTYKIKFIGNIRFLVSALLSLAYNITEGLHKGKCEELNKICNSLILPNVEERCLSISVHGPLAKIQ